MQLKSLVCPLPISEFIFTTLFRLTYLGNIFWNLVTVCLSPPPPFVSTPDGEKNQNVRTEAAATYYSREPHPKQQIPIWAFLVHIWVKAGRGIFWASESGQRKKFFCVVFPRLFLGRHTVQYILLYYTTRGEGDRYQLLPTER